MSAWAGYIQRLWYAEDAAVSGRLVTLLLSIPAFLYGRIMAVRAWCYRTGFFKTCKLPKPVISVGNITVGGTGKTPVTAWIARNLIAKGLRVAVLSRGYGGSLEGCCAVVSDGSRLLLGPEQCGDEPCLLAGSVPGLMVVIGADRYQAGLLAMEQLQPDIFLLDDGFQHLRLHRDLNILLQDCLRPVGNGCILPAGPLREPVSACKRANLLVFMRCGAKRGSDAEISDHPACFSSHILTEFRRLDTGETVERQQLHQGGVAAFAGIADPDSFFNSLFMCGIPPVATLAFPDHESYGQATLAKLEALAGKPGITWLLTTEKDGVKLGRGSVALKSKVIVAKLDLVFEDDTLLIQALNRFSLK